MKSKLSSPCMNHHLQSFQTIQSAEDVGRYLDNFVVRKNTMKKMIIDTYQNMSYDQTKLYENSKTMMIMTAIVIMIMTITMMRIMI